MTDREVVVTSRGVVVTSRGVVVTGLGVVTSVGHSVEAFWRALLAGAVGTGPARTIDLAGLRSDRAGEVHGFDAAPYFRRIAIAGHQRATQLAVAAARMAVDDAGVALDEVGERAGIVMGAVVANRPGLEAPYLALRGGAAVELSLDNHDVCLIAEAPAIELGLRGPVLVLPTACAAGNSAIGCAADLIADGHADVMLAGGVDELSPAMFVMFSQFDSLSPDVLRPFDRDRRGLILSEGAGVVVLESAAHAEARGARSYGRVAGHGNNADAHDMTHPHPDGLGAEVAMRAALSDAGLAAEQIDFVCAHGTGTPANDGIEARAIRRVLGERADRVPVTSIKSSLGHSQGAASAIEAVACLLAMRDGVVPPTMNIRTLDPECPIDVVMDRPRAQRIDVAVNNAFGFGGNISCVIFAR